MLSLSKAARLARTSKATIHRQIKSGKLSATRQDDGSYSIDPSELARVHPISVIPLEPVAAPSAETIVTPPDPALEPAGTPVLAAELMGARQLIHFLETQVSDLRQDRDAWRQQAERLALAAPVITPAPATSARPWWRRMAG